MEIAISLRQKFINKKLQGVKCKANLYNTYGLVMRINAFTMLVASDFIIPSFRLITLVAFKFKRTLVNVEVFRIPIHSKDN